jgi:transcriptional regulator with XRE-family HTH domain
LSLARGFIAKGGRVTTEQAPARMPPMSALKTPNPVDIHVGSRVRLRRMMLAISQEKLAKALGLSFQQVQKYEKGANRIGASRLEQISRFLQVPVAFFFEGASDTSAVATSEEDTRSLALMNEFASSPDGLRLIQSFAQVEDADVRRRIVDLVQAIGSKNRDR